MKYSPLRFAKEFPKEKRKKDNYVCRLFIRPISFVVASAFATLGISANIASILGFLCGVTSCCFLVVDYFLNIPALVLTSVVLFIVWLVLDCVDGNIARTVKSEKYGDFFDAISGYIYPGVYFALFGFYASKTYDIVFDGFVFWAGLISSLSSLSFLLLILNKKKYEENSLLYTNEKPLNTSSGKLNRLVWIFRKAMDEINFGGLMSFVLLFAYFFNFCSLAVIIYSSIFLLMSVAGNTLLILKAYKNRK